MLHDSGTLTICSTENTAASGDMAKERLIPGNKHFYGERTVGYGRQYAAMGVSQQVDMLAEIWQDRSVRIGMYAVLDNDEQYRIDNVQHLENEDGLKVTYLSMRRLDDLYDIAEEIEDLS